MGERRLKKRTQRLSLKPAETIQRILISSTSRFIAEYESKGVLITHAFPGFRNPGGYLRFKESPLSRTAYMISFVVPEVERAEGVVIPDYEEVGDRVCSLLSLLYGKRFDSHGGVESHGGFKLPHLEQFNSLCNPKLPQNDHGERSDIAIPLDFRQIARIEPMLMGRVRVRDRARATSLSAAAKFYHQALQNAESDPEIAYLHLITAGEILANAHLPQNDDLLDEGIRAILDQIRQSLPDGAKAARMLASQMRQIKRRFQSTVEDLIDERFFVVTEGEPAWKRFKVDDLRKSVSAAYDIRSRYVHTGLSFGDWIAPRWDDLAEIRRSRPTMEDKELSKLLGTAPTYIGLERVIRYCLIRFAELHKLFVEASGH